MFYVLSNGNFDQLKINNVLLLDNCSVHLLSFLLFSREVVSDFV